MNPVAVDVLIGDDSPIARRIIRHLEQIGCEVVGEAENGAQRVKLFHELKPRLIILT